MEQQLHHWLNGRWGAGRRVVKILVDGDKWIVRATEDFGDNAQVRSWNPPSEEDALQLADELMSDPRPGDVWREITTTR